MRAKEQIEHYEKIYNIFDYASQLQDVMYTLETQIASQNPTIPFNMYRQSKSTKMENLITDIENCFKSYFDLMDDLSSNPLWVKKLEKDLGQSVSYLALTLDESSREALVLASPSFARFENEKRKYFKWDNVPKQKTDHSKGEKHWQRPLNLLVGR